MGGFVMDYLDLGRWPKTGSSVKCKNERRGAGRELM